jgi:hypothetical protein
MVWYFNMQGREVVSINARLEDLATIDAFCKKRNISRSSLQAALAFCAAKKGKPIQFRGPSRASTAWQLKRHVAASTTLEIAAKSGVRTNGKRHPGSMID